MKFPTAQEIADVRIDQKIAAQKVAEARRQEEEERRRGYSQEVDRAASCIMSIAPGLISDAVAEGRNGILIGWGNRDAAVYCAAVIQMPKLDKEPTKDIVDILRASVPKHIQVYASQWHDGGGMVSGPAVRFSF
jgi:hypothetical protein